MAQALLLPAVAAALNVGAVCPRDMKRCLLVCKAASEELTVHCCSSPLSSEGGGTLLHYAAAKGSLAALQLCLLAFELPMDGVDDAGRTPLQVAVSEDNRIEEGGCAGHIPSQQRREHGWIGRLSVQALPKHATASGIRR